MNTIHFFVTDVTLRRKISLFDHFCLFKIKINKQSMFFNKFFDMLIQQLCVNFDIYTLQ